MPLLNNATETFTNYLSSRASAVQISNTVESYSRYIQALSVSDGNASDKQSKREALVHHLYALLNTKYLYCVREIAGKHPKLNCYWVVGVYRDIADMADFCNNPDMKRIGNIANQSISDDEIYEYIAETFRNTDPENKYNIAQVAELSIMLLNSATTDFYVDYINTYCSQSFVNYLSTISPTTTDFTCNLDTEQSVSHAFGFLDSKFILSTNEGKTLVSCIRRSILEGIRLTSSIKAAYSLTKAFSDNLTNIPFIIHRGSKSDKAPWLMSFLRECSWKNIDTKVNTHYSPILTYVQLEVNKAIDLLTDFNVSSDELNTWLTKHIGLPLFSYLKQYTNRDIIIDLPTISDCTLEISYNTIGGYIHDRFVVYGDKIEKLDGDLDGDCF